MRTMTDEPTGTVAQRLEELGLHLHPEIPYDLEKMFPKLTGWGAKKDIKGRHKLIVQVEEKLKLMLQPGEEVLYVAKGVQYKISEQYFLGHWAALINQTLFVLTNLRLLMMNTNTKGKPRHTYWMIYYSQIEQFKATWHGSVFLKLRDGTKLRFSGFNKLDKNHMPMIFQEALATYRQLGFDPPATQSRENLCSFCMHVVPKDQYTCGVCGAEFWRPSAVALRTLVFPAWGDFVMRHYGLATFKLVTYGIIWLALIDWIIESLRHAVPLGPVLIEVLFILAIEHGVFAFLTYYIAKRGLHPKGKPTIEAVGESSG
jgi:hypothetical protein